MRKFSSIFLIIFLLLSHNIQASAGELELKEEKSQISAEPTMETSNSIESSNDIQEFSENEDKNYLYTSKNDQSSNEHINDELPSSEEVDGRFNNNSLKETDKSVRKLGGVTGRWFVINGQTMFFNPTLNIVKDSIAPIIFSKIISQNSGSSTNFSETILFSDNIAIQSLPEITVPTNTTYTIEYSVDKSIFDSVPPTDITQLKGIRVVFSKMISSERVEIKNTATIDWENTNSGINELAQFFEDDRLNGTVFFDSYRMVTATYIDEFGNNLIDPKVFYGELGQEYITSEIEIPNYRLISMPKNATGKFSDKDQIVTYIYERIEGAPVTVDYIDTEGNELAPSETLTDKAGLPYETAAKNIPNWKLTEMPANAKGTFSEEAQTVLYVYDRAEATPVTVDYIDTEGNELAPSEILTGKIGLSYESAAKNIPSWKLTKIPTNAKGTFSEEAQTVLYVYDRAEATPVTVQYQDIEGNELAPSEILTGKIGLSYESVAKNISGWKLIETPKNAKGIFDEKAQTVLYEYKKDQGKESIKTPNEHFSNKNRLSENSSSLSASPKNIRSQLPLAGERLTPLLSTVGGIGLVILSIFIFYRRK
ncbi:MucBP domain-containing protein [Enterococcus sp. AZ177]|uniref:MucBP domain-containing protein n=1 Tax=unclassified Enterococcus TaxID=2608891 RepID=UPI003D301766